MFLFLATMGGAVYAQSGSATPEWFTEMLQWKKDKVEEAVNNGDLTKEEAERYNERFDDMEKYHEENGFDDYPQRNKEGRGFGRHMGGKGFGRGAGYCH